VISLSLIIVSYNSSSVIVPCLESLHCLTDVEIIIVDNASTDTTRNLIEVDFPHVFLIKNSVNKGFAAAANQGFASASGRWVMFLNPDTVLRVCNIDSIMKFLKHTNRASVIGCRMVDESGLPQPSCWKAPSLCMLFLDSFLPYRTSRSLISEIPQTVREVDMVSGACMIVRREVFDDLGGFDERFFMYYEDADFCLRARKKNYRIYYTPDISICHRIANSTDSEKNRFFRYLYASKLTFYKKHFRGIRSLLAWIFIVSGVVLRIIAYAWIGIFGVNKFQQLTVNHLGILRMIIRGEWKTPAK